MCDDDDENDDEERKKMKEKQRHTKGVKCVREKFYTYKDKENREHERNFPTPTQQTIEKMWWEEKKSSHSVSCS